jgi:type III secretion HrpO family protein
MIHAQIIQLAYKGMLLILILSGPPILVSMFFGLAVAIFQAATQIQEQTISFTVKLIAVVVTLMTLGGWLGAQILRFASEIFLNFPRWV